MKNIMFFLLVTTSAVATYTIYKVTERNKVLMDNLDQCDARLKLLKGDLAASFHSVDLGQNPQILNFVDSGQYSLVQFIEPNCGGCMKQIDEYWLRLNTDSKFDHVAQKLVSLGSFEDTVSKIPKEYWIDNLFVASDPAVQRAYSIEKVPTTLLISPEGKVEWLYSDLMTEEIYQEILEKIGI